MEIFELALYNIVISCNATSPERMN